jgi:hypothetical protein
MESCKALGSDRKQPDQKGGCLKDWLNEINEMARNLIGYRYTIPQLITQQDQ